MGVGGSVILVYPLIKPEIIFGNEVIFLWYGLGKKTRTRITRIKMFFKIFEL